MAPVLFGDKVESTTTFFIKKTSFNFHHQFNLLKMKRTFTLWAAIGSLFAGTAFAQTPAHRTCGTLEAIEQLQKADPGFKTRMEQNERAIARYLSNPAKQHNRAGAATKIIPVVFHVVYNNASQNVSDAQLLQQLTALNKDYRRLNADTINDPSVFRQLGSDTGIEFALATKDPSGNPTTGITRTTTSTASFSVGTPNAVKANSTGGKDPWPNADYLNIWVCNLGGGILGYATPPGGPAASDGVVLLYSSLPGGSAAPYNLGRTATHEVGHYLNLRHIWGDEPACAQDDQVGDTPQQKGENYGCPTFPLISGAGASCTPGSPGAMFMNYMDYTDDACMHMFSLGQGDRMLAALATSRPTLQTSANTNTFYANFSASSTTIQAGSSTSFSDLSTGTPTGWSWSFPGAVTTTSTVQNPTNIRYNTPGKYPVTLTITKGSASNTRTTVRYINVTNPVNCTDTLNLPLPGTGTLLTTSSGGVKNGYVAGNNAAGDKAKAEYFANPLNYTRITGGLLKFGKAKAANASSLVTIAVWDTTGGGGKPGAILASKTVPISTIISDVAANQMTSVLFTTPIVVNGPFYMGVQLSSTTGDTVALITNTTTANKGWERLANNTWQSYSAGRSLNISNAIFPSVSAVPPVANFTSASSVCAGETVTYTNTSTGATSYLWTFPGGSPGTSTAANPTVTYSALGTYDVLLQVTTGACGMIGAVNRLNAITVKTLPTVSVTPQTVSVCGSVNTTLTASGASTYTWSPATGLNTTTGATVIASPSVTTTYTVTGTTNGCTNSKIVAIIVQNAVANFTASQTTVTAGTPVSFTNTSTGSGTGVLFYSWNFGDPSAGTVNSSTQQNPPPFTYVRPGNYTVTLQAAKGSCNNTKTVTITVLPAATGLEEAYAKGNIRIYPNPAKNYLTVEAPEEENITEVVLTNAIGQLVASQKPVSGQARLNLNSVAGGMYFVKITSSKGSITKKVTILP